MHSQSEVRVALTFPKEAIGPDVLIDFVGLSYEVQQLSGPSFFSGKNSGLICEFKELSSTGVLAIGSNSSEFASWNLRLILPNQSIRKSVKSLANRKAQNYAVTPGAVRNLAAFLQATGWTGV